MRLFLLILFAVPALSACVQKPSADGRAAAHEAIDAAMRSPPPREATALPPLTPSTQLESQVRQLSARQLAEWVMPGAAAASVIRAQHYPGGMMPRLGATALFQAPRATGRAGVCEVRGWDIIYRVPNESSLTYEQHLNPPIQPYQSLSLLKWKVIGSTLEGNGASGAACTAATPDLKWFDAPSAEAVHRAIGLIERAQRRPTPTRLTCTTMGYEEGRQDAVYLPCADARALLKQLTPNLIRRVAAGECPDCWTVEYEDPANPDSHSVYVVTASPRELRIVQALLPPH